MRNECNIVKDLLPLYVEGIVNEDTADFVEEHIRHCEKCRKELEEMKSPNYLESDAASRANDDLSNLKQFKQEWTKKNRILIRNKTLLINICMFVLIGFLAVIYVVDASKLLRYEKPFFCIEVDSIEDDGIGEYVGLGFRFTASYADMSHFPPETTDLYIYEYHSILSGPGFQYRTDMDSNKTVGVVLNLQLLDEANQTYLLSVVDANDIVEKYLITSRTAFYDQNGTILSEMNAEELKFGMKLVAFSGHYPETIRDDIYPATEIKLYE